MRSTPPALFVEIDDLPLHIVHQESPPSRAHTN
jgi:hypothetical protein